LDVWRNTATLMGTERTGPDLTDVGNRQPSKEWNLVHLYNPRIVVKESIMPAYPFLFEYKSIPAKEDVVVNIPEDFAPSNGKKVVASKEAMQLIAYLQSLKQVKLEADVPEFLYKRDRKSTRLNSSHVKISYAVFCLKKKRKNSHKKIKLGRMKFGTRILEKIPRRSQRRKVEKGS